MLAENLFLVCGSGAGEGIPSPFCNCRVCHYARAHGGKDVRTRVGYQLGSRIRIEWSPDAAYQAQRYNLDYSLLEHLFITHSHYEHFCSRDFATRLSSISPELRGVLHVYGNEKIGETLLSVVGGDLSACKLEFHLLQPFKPVAVNQAVITPLPAIHTVDEQTFLFLIEAYGKRILLGHDSEIFPDITRDFVRGRHCDYIFPDATWGLRREEWVRSAMPNALKVYRALVELGAADDDSLVYPTHFSPTCGYLHSEILDYLLPYPNIWPAYDGLMVDLADPANY